MSGEEGSVPASACSHNSQGANKRLVVHYLTGLMNGKWDGQTDVLSDEYVFSERDGFRAGKVILHPILDVILLLYTE